MSLGFTCMHALPKSITTRLQGITRTTLAMLRARQVRWLKGLAALVALVAPTPGLALPAPAHVHELFDGARGGGGARHCGTREAASDGGC